MTFWSLSSRPQKSALTALHLAGIVLAAWLMFGGGISVVGRWFGADWSAGDLLRRGLLMACAAVYFVRLAATGWVFLRRPMPVAEVASVAPFVVVINVVYATVGGGNAAPVGAWTVLGVTVYLLGSFLNTFSELQRHRFKLQPANAGRLYTRGLFSLAMHVNFFGDVVLFTGFSMVAGDAWTLLIPVAMAAGFVFFHIPRLDRHLAAKYGQDFDAWSARTRKLIPWIY
ncbi:MAG: hypothetical protein BIFFINMI_01537 [Phycisphaerae bacterium]|nr:hypothetical protein [Phycisphaerae bacterium]